MLVKLQDYDFNYEYKRGGELYLAHTLSRAFIQSSKPSKAESEIQNVNAISVLSPNENLEEIRMLTESDLKVLKTTITIQNGWPDEKDKVNTEIRQYFNIRNELTVHDGIILKGERIVIPKSLRKDMMSLIHSFHLGMEGCLRRA